MKKSIVLLCAACLLFCLSVTAFAGGVYTEKALEYTISDESVTIVGYFGTDESVTVPSMIAGYPVNTIAAGAFTKPSLRTVYLPDTVTTIQGGAIGGGVSVVYNSNVTTPAPTQPTTPPATTPAPTQPTTPPATTPAPTQPTTPPAITPAPTQPTTPPATTPAPTQPTTPPATTPAATEPTNPQNPGNTTQAPGSGYQQTETADSDLSAAPGNVSTNVWEDDIELEESEIPTVTQPTQAEQTDQTAQAAPAASADPAAPAEAGTPTAKPAPAARKTRSSSTPWIIIAACIALMLLGTVIWKKGFKK